MNYKYRYYVFTKNIEIIEDEKNNYRYSLRLPFSKLPQNKVLVILKNPSIATRYHPDYTINKICDYCYQNGFDEVVVTNLFAYRAKHPNDMVNAALNNKKDVIGSDNDNYIKAEMSKVNKIIVAWGEYPINYKKQYVERIKNVLNFLQGNDLFYVEKLSKKDRSPLHARSWGNDMPLIKMLKIEQWWV